MFKRNFVMMHSVPGAAGGGDGGPAPAPGATQPAAPASPADFIPEKFRVMSDDGIDVGASARKLAESYAHLETRFRSGDLPPSAAEEYKVSVPDEFKDVYEDNAAMRAKAHELGLTQKQFDGVMAEYFRVAPALVNGAVNNTVDTVIAELTEAWGDGPAYDKSLADAHKTFEAFADPGDRGKFDSLITNPAMAFRILAKIAPELGEAGGIPAAAETGGQESVKDLLTSEANTNPRHPQHAATRAKIDAYYSKRYGNEPVR